MNHDKEVRNHLNQVLTSACVASASTITGLLTHAGYGDTAQMVELALAVGAGAASFKVLASDHRTHGIGEAAGISLGWLSAFLAGAGAAGWDGGGAQTFWGWLGSGVVGYGLSFAWQHHQRHDRLEMHHRRVNIHNAASNQRLMELREEMALLKLRAEYASQVPAAQQVNPVFANSTAGGIQRAVWSLTGGKIILNEPKVVDTEHGWKAVVDLSGYSMKKLQRDLDGVTQALDLDNDLEARPGDSKRFAVLEYREPPVWPSSAPWKPSSTTPAWDAPLRLGVDGYGSEVLLDLSIHAAIAGGTGFGKSNLINSMILQLAERDCVSVIGVDMKPFAPEFTPLKPLLADLVTDLKGAHKALDWMIEEMYRRGEIMQRNGWKKWVPTPEDPMVYQFWDEYAEVIRQDKSRRGRGRRVAGDSIQEKVETILAMARSYGLFLVLCTQQPSAKLFGEDTGPRGNLPIRVCFTTTDANHDRFVLPSGGGWSTSLLDGQVGRFLMVSSAHRTPEPYLAYEVSDTILNQELARRSPVVPPQQPAVLSLVKSASEPPATFSEAADAILVSLALSPATRRELADRLGLSADASQLKNALTKLAREDQITRDEDNVWSLVG